MKKKKVKKKKACDHKWVWLDCHEGLVCERPCCNMYTRDINKAPFGETKLIYMEMAHHKKQVRELTSSRNFWQTVAIMGWVLAATLVGLILFAKTILVQ